MTLFATPFDEAAHRADMRRETIVAALGWEDNSAIAREIARVAREAAAYHHERGDHVAGSEQSAQARAAEWRATKYQREATKLRASLRREA